MNEVYTLRVVVELLREDDAMNETLKQLRSQELSGDLCELAMMLPAVNHMAEGMALSVVGSEQRRHAEVKA